MVDESSNSNREAILKRRRSTIRSFKRTLILFLTFAGLVATLVGLARDRLGAFGDDSADGAAKIWESPETCKRELASGARLEKASDKIRIGTWNIRWFPDGGPGASPIARTAGPKPTDVAWLACAIAWLQIDVLVLQEIKGTDRARVALGRLTTELDRSTGGRFRVELDRCPGKGRQHIAFLFDEKRVKGDRFRNIAALNPHGEACEKNLRPGFGAYFRSASGTDFHLVGVHFDSGPKRRDYDDRRRSLDGLRAAFEETQRITSDEDVIVAGDFNTMGCARCSPKISAAAERAAMDERLRTLPHALRRVPSAPACTQYYRGRPSGLDHVLVSRASKGLPPGTSARIAGYCEVAGCARVGDGRMPRAYEELSDHCPVVLDWVDRDLD